MTVPTKTAYSYVRRRSGRFSQIGSHLHMPNKSNTHSYPQVFSSFELPLVDGALELEEVSIGGIELLNAQVDEVGQRLHDALLQRALYHMAEVVAALHAQGLQVAVVMLKKLVLHARHKVTHLGQQTLTAVCISFYHRFTNGCPCSQLRIWQV